VTIESLGGNVRMRIRRAITVPVVATLTAAAGLVTAAAVMSASAAIAGCSVTYSVSSQWPAGFTANLNLTNFGDPLTS
jgi:hypothetical protein